MSSSPDLQPAPLGFDVSSSAGTPMLLASQNESRARAVGYATGWSTGVAQARAAMAGELAAARDEAARLISDTRARLATALAAIDIAATAMELQSVPTAQEMEDVLLGCAVELAETLLTRELREVDTANDALARTLKLAPAGEPVTVALCPQDFAILAIDNSGAVYPALVSTYRRAITVVPDASLVPGDAVVQCGATTVDGRLSAGIARVRSALAS